MKKLIILIVFGVMLAAGAAYADAGAVEVADAGAVAANVAADGVAAGASVDISEDPVGFFKSTYDAAKSGQWWMLASFLVVALVWLARKFGKKIDWFNTDRGGAALALGIGIFGGMAHGILAGDSVSLGMLSESIKVTVGAMGGYVAVKKSLFPSDEK